MKPQAVIVGIHFAYLFDTLLFVVKKDNQHVLREAYSSKYDFSLTCDFIHVTHVVLLLSFVHFL